MLTSDINWNDQIIYYIASRIPSETTSIAVNKIRGKQDNNLINHVINNLIPANATSQR